MKHLSLVNFHVTAINSLDDKSSDLSDPTDSGKEEKTSNNQKFANKKKKTKLPSVKKYFIKNGNDYYCETCKVDVPISSRSDANLRSHLAKNHYMEEVLYPSQKKSLKLNNKNIELDPKEKKILDSEMINCIITDSRAFCDFNKPGMKRFLNILKPGYKPCCREKVAKVLKLKLEIKIHLFYH